MLPHCTPRLNSPHTPNPQPRSSGGLKPQRGQIWGQNRTFVRWGRRHPLFLWGERHLCAVSALAQRHLLLPRTALALFNTGVAGGGTRTPSPMGRGDGPQQGGDRRSSMALLWGSDPSPRSDLCFFGGLPPFLALCTRHGGSDATGGFLVGGTGHDHGAAGVVITPKSLPLGLAGLFWLRRLARVCSHTGKEIGYLGRSRVGASRNTPAVGVAPRCRKKKPTTLKPKKPTPISV